MVHNSNYWNSIAEKIPKGQDYDVLLAEHYRISHLNLLTRWIDFSKQQKILKTDLFAEALCPERSFVWEILKTPCDFTGIDISPDICQKAGEMASILVPGSFPVLISCDLRKLPFADNSYDVIISDSSLDHYSNSSDIEVAIRELFRILKPGGSLVITMDNKTNLTEPLFRIWILLNLAPFFIGKTYSMQELKRSLENNGFEVLDSAPLIHNPRFFSKFFANTLRRYFPDKCEFLIRKQLGFYDSLDNKLTKYLTAQFVAAKAKKPLT